MQKIIYKLETPSDELEFAYYILFICSHAYTVRKKCAQLRGRDRLVTLDEKLL